MTSFADFAHAFKGKTIENVAARNATDGGAADLTLWFTDGTAFTISSEITWHGTDEQAAEHHITIEKES